ncbi:MAG: hypothetical protein HQ530_00820 [Parcubacteria group bacterium]|nr:hypothetical protein [Parcubacteria group bacterium]
MIKSLLKQLDFSEKEMVVYLELIKAGSARAYELARETELNRTTIYDICEVLSQRGLISKFKKGKTTYFNALDPKQLLTYLDREKEEKNKIIDRQKGKVKELLPEFMSLQDLPSTRPKIQFFEGEKGMREAYEDTLTAKEIILAYANVETMHKALPNFFPQYYKRRASKKIFIRAIMPPNKMSQERAQKDQEEMRESRFLPTEDKTFSPETNLYNNKMLIASWKEKIAILIESKELVDLQKMIYNLVWENLPKNK